MILTGEINHIILTHKDRLLRFGNEIIFILCQYFGVSVTCIEEEMEVSDDVRLAKDVLEIITVFSARLYGKRAHKNKI